MPVSFFYDEQIRRFLLQFTRIFSGFQVEYGRDDAGNVTYLTVPVRYADASRQAQTILQENSKNTVPCAPLISFYITDIQYARDRVQEPYFVDRKLVRQREYDEVSQTYEETQGNAFTVERPMPVPYNMMLNVDIWTTNMNQKLQLFEQITTMFNPSLEIQSTDNYLDWSSLSVVEMTGNRFRSGSIPQGTEDEIEFLTFNFQLPIWLSPPAKVFKGGVVHKVITSMYDASGDLHNALFQEDLLLGTRVKVTPHGYRIMILDNTIQILPASQPGQDPYSFDPIEYQESPLHWVPVIEEYGTLRDGITQIRIYNDVINSEIIGTIGYHPTEEDKLIFNVDIDTLPENTMSPVDAVIDPLRGAPNLGLPTAITGQRYLLLDDIGSNLDNETAQAWTGTGGEELIAKANDIIEYDGSKWIISYVSNPVVNNDYVTNVTTGLQYRWTGEAWVRSWEGIYPGGEWSIVI